MKKPIRLKILSRQFDYDNYDPADGKNEMSETFEEMELICDGLFLQENGRIEIRYRENESSGMLGSVTSVSYEEDTPGLVTILRSGTVSTALIFREGERTACTYEIPEGRLEVMVYTRRLKNSIGKDGDRLLLDYDVEFGGVTKLRTRLELALIPEETA